MKRSYAKLIQFIKTGLTVLHVGLFVLNYLCSLGLLAPHTVHTVSGFAGHIYYIYGSLSLARKNQPATKIWQCWFVLLWPTQFEGLYPFEMHYYGLVR